MSQYSNINRANLHQNTNNWRGHGTQKCWAVQKCKNSMYMLCCVCIRERERGGGAVYKDKYESPVCHLHTHPSQQIHLDPHHCPPNCNISMMVCDNYQVDYASTIM